MKSSFCIDLQRFMLIPTKFPLIPLVLFLVFGSYKKMTRLQFKWDANEFCYCKDRQYFLNKQT